MLGLRMEFLCFGLELKLGFGIGKHFLVSILALAFSPQNVSRGSNSNPGCTSSWSKDSRSRKAVP